VLVPASRLTVPLLAWALWQATCAVPLAPGYHIRKQEAELHYTPARPGQVHVQVRYELENTGNAPLPMLAIALPAAAVRTDSGLAVSVEGKFARPQPDTELQPPGAAGKSRIELAVEFSPPWPQKERIELILGYDLPFASRPGTEPVPAAGSSGDAPESFYFAFEDWFPELIPPDHVFARGTSRAEKVRVRIRVPEGWRALSSGTPKGARTRRGESEHHYEVTHSDFDPFILAGSYHEQRVHAHGLTVVFWTYAPLDAAVAESAGARLAQTVSFYEATFGSRELSGRRPVWIVESRISGNRSFARGVVLDAPSLAAGFVGDAARVTDALLGRIWFGHIAKAQDSEENLADALVFWLSRWAAEAQGADWNRSEDVRHWLRQYDQASRGTEHAAPPGQNSAPNRGLAESVRARLLLTALEDRVGRGHLQAALKRMVQARRGQDWNANDLRAATESESGQNLGEFFRTWLGQPGIPDEFRKHYESQPAGNGCTAPSRVNPWDHACPAWRLRASFTPGQ
jgi:hypothetical protein